MFLDANFLIDLAEELRQRQVGPARSFLGTHRNDLILVSVVAFGEVAAGMAGSHAARKFFGRFRVVSLKPEIALEAASVDRELMNRGLRLGENDNWIAGFCRYYGQALVTRDADFERVQGLRTLRY